MWMVESEALISSGLGHAYVAGSAVAKSVIERNPHIRARDYRAKPTKKLKS